MNQKFGSLGQLRVKQSINANNVAAVELAAVQFEATEAASECIAGWVTEHCRAAGSPARWRNMIVPRALPPRDVARSRRPHSTCRSDARQRLGATSNASCRFGRNDDRPRGVRGDGGRYATSQRGRWGQRVVGSDQRNFPAPKLQGYELQHTAPIQADTAAKAPTTRSRDIRNLKINWCERQLASVVEGNVLYVSNRFHIGAFDLNNGQRMWIAETFPGNRLQVRRLDVDPDAATSHQ